MQRDVDLEKNVNRGVVKRRVNESMQAKRFALVLDDVWGRT
jgi:hypothetical protein